MSIKRHGRTVSSCNDSLRKLACQTLSNARSRKRRKGSVKRGAQDQGGAAAGIYGRLQSGRGWPPSAALRLPAPPAKAGENARGREGARARGREGARARGRGADGRGERAARRPRGAKSVFAAQVREQQYVANRRAVGQQHHEPVDADPAAACRRHSVFERADVVGVEEHRLFVARVLLLDLLPEARGLVFGVVQFREAVRDFAAGDEQLEALGDARHRVRFARERRHLDRVVDDEGRFPQLRFGGFLEERELQRADAGVQERRLRDVDAQALEFAAQERVVRQLTVRVVRCVFLDRLRDRQATERLGEIELAALVPDRRGAERVDGRLADQPLGEVHQPAVIGVRGVELHHREFRIVARRHAFVPEVAVDLEHALEAADDQALQVKLGRDAQEHLHVERIVMRDERLRGRAARDRVQHRRLDFHEIGVAHELADRRDRLRARAERRARLGRDDQIDVALAIARFLVGEAVELVGQRTQRLREQPQLRALHRQLALVRAKQHAARGDDVAQVPLLERVVRFGADIGGRHEELDLTRTVLHRREARLAHHALEHHPAGDRDVERLRVERFLVGVRVFGLQTGRVVRRLEVVRIGDALVAQRAQLVAALRDDLVFVRCDSGLRLGRFGHDGRVRG
ncbi:Hypothetical protein BURPS1710b_2724 [Burkholderia pseudomallei 1710b]|uniref:Uncharacterized protein n=1 Tax=Burkholderia pseudomallei (strain 1710b) TaxID=320372 RepID=Q3JQP4_BURP1|nr:Hypothetical protein BURPS1710b_2724 [Burkholderia pseudomallei 1710b]